MPSLPPSSLLFPLSILIHKNIYRGDVVLNAGHSLKKHGQVGSTLFIEGVLIRGLPSMKRDNLISMCCAIIMSIILKYNDYYCKNFKEHLIYIQNTIDSFIEKLIITRDEREFGHPK